MASKVFISWGGDLSKELAEAIRDWLPKVLQFVQPYFTPDDIEKGSMWGREIAQELSSSNFGIICLTKDNTTRPWILFEAGALSKNVGQSRVCPVLFNVESSEITGPLINFQTTQFNKADFKELIRTINSNSEDFKLSTPILDAVFEQWWPELEEKVKTIIKNHASVEKQEKPTKKERSERDILDEILNLTRLSTQQSPRRITIIQIALKRLQESLEKLQNHSKGFEELSTLNEIYLAIEQLCAELSCPFLPELFELQKNRQRIFPMNEK